MVFEPRQIETRAVRVLGPAWAAILGLARALGVPRIILIVPGWTIGALPLRRQAVRAHVGAARAQLADLAFVAI